MKYLKLFELYQQTDKTINVKTGTYEVGSNKKTAKNTIYDKSWEILLPENIKVNYHNQHNSFKKGNIMINSDMLQITYDRITKIDGIPDTLEFDIYFTKSNGKIKLDVDITYGDLMACEFSVEQPNNVDVIEYTSYHSKNDRSNTVFALSTESLSKFVNFLNKFGMKLNLRDFKFLDDKDNYNPNVINESLKYDIQEIRELFVDLEDSGFSVKITKEHSIDLSQYFINKNVVRSNDISFTHNTKHDLSYYIVIKKIGHESKFNEIIETLKFVESYSKSEMKLKIQQIYIIDPPNYLYYKSIDDIEINKNFTSISIALSDLNV